MMDYYYYYRYYSDYAEKLNQMKFVLMMNLRMLLLYWLMNLNVINFRFNEYIFYLFEFVTDRLAARN